MSSFKARLEGCQVLRKIKDKEKCFIFYTSFTDDNDCLWEICVSDGVNVWQLALSEHEVEELIVENKANSITDLSCCLSSGVVELLWSTSHLLTITLSSHSIHLKLNLTQLSSDQCKPQVQRLIFDLWTQLDTTRSQLTECHKRLEDNQQKRENNVMVEVSQSSRVTTGARAKRPVGASLVNPSLKRRKAVKGVVFGDSQDND